MNVLSNAIKYTPDGGRIVLTAGCTPDRVWLEVADNGIGIPPEDRDRIFERFYRGVEQSNRTADGVGLGLAIVKHVALTHHGDVTVWSAPGQGSTFSLTLPLAQ